MPVAQFSSWGCNCGVRSELLPWHQGQGQGIDRHPPSGRATGVKAPRVLSLSSVCHTFFHAEDAEATVHKLARTRAPCRTSLCRTDLLLCVTALQAITQCCLAVLQCTTLYVRQHVFCPACCARSRYACTTFLRRPHLDASIERIPFPHNFSACVLYTLPLHHTHCGATLTLPYFANTLVQHTSALFTSASPVSPPLLHAVLRCVESCGRPARSVLPPPSFARPATPSSSHFCLPVFCPVATNCIQVSPPPASLALLSRHCACRAPPPTYPSAALRAKLEEDRKDRYITSAPQAGASWPPNPLVSPVPHTPSPPPLAYTLHVCSAVLRAKSEKGRTEHCLDCYHPLTLASCLHLPSPNSLCHPSPCHLCACTCSSLYLSTPVKLPAPPSAPPQKTPLPSHLYTLHVYSAVLRAKLEEERNGRFSASSPYPAVPPPLLPFPNLSLHHTPPHITPSHLSCASLISHSVLLSSTMHNCILLYPSLVPVSPPPASSAALRAKLEEDRKERRRYSSSLFRLPYPSLKPVLNRSPPPPSFSPLPPRLDSATNVNPSPLPHS
jgi:hypothetical protein